MPLYDETGTTTYRPPPAIPRVNLTAPPEEQTPYTTWRQEEYLPQDRAQPVWAVEDRIVYLREQQRQRELQRQEEERRRREALQMAWETAALNRWVTSEQRVREGLMSPEMRWRYTVTGQDVPPETYGVPAVYQNELNQGPGPAQFWQETVGRAIPPLEPVARAAGQAGAWVGRRAAAGLVSPLGELGPQLPGAERGENIGEKTGRTVAESLVPTEVWQVALEVIPGIGLTGTAARAGARSLIRAAAENGVDLTPAGIRAFAKSERGQALIRALREERGGVRLPPWGRNPAEEVPAPRATFPGQENVARALTRAQEAERLTGYGTRPQITPPPYVGGRDLTGEALQKVREGDIVWGILDGRDITPSMKAARAISGRIPEDWTGDALQQVQDIGDLSRWIDQETEQFSPAVEQLLRRGADNGVDRRLFSYALNEARRPVPDAWPLKAWYSRAKALLWIEPAAERNPIIQQSLLASTRYSEAQIQRFVSTSVGMETAIKQAFENPLGVNADLVARYVGPRVAEIDPYIGTAWHYLDNPDLYPKATAAQKRAAMFWDTITRSELRFSKRVGVPAHEWQEMWIAHSYKDPEKALAASGTGRSTLTKERKLTTEEYARFAAEHDLEVDTDVMAIFNRRMMASARARTDIVYLDTVAEQAGGKRLRPGMSTPRGMTRIERRGMAWAIPDTVAPQVVDSLALAQAPVSERALGELVDAARATLLNLDFSVGGGRQFQLAFDADPVGAIRTYGKAAQVLQTKEGWATWYAEAAPKLEFWSQHGASFRMSPLDTTAAVRGEIEHGVDKVPIVRSLNRLQFEVLMPMAKLNTMERLYDMLRVQKEGGFGSWFRGIPIIDKINSKLTKPLSRYSDNELADVVADATNNWLGGIEWAKVGSDPGVLRKLILLTEGWTRAQVGAMINAPKLTPKGVLARRLIAQELAMTAAISTGASLALTGELPSYDPRAKDFLDVRTPAGRISILPHKTVMRSFIRGIAGKPPDEFGSESFWGQRFEAGQQFAMGRIGQIPRLLWDLKEGRDYYGRPTGNWAWYAAQQFMPIVVQGIVQDIQDGRSPGVVVGRAATEFAGFTARPKTVYDFRDESRERLAKQAGYADFNAMVADRGYNKAVVDLSQNPEHAKLEENAAAYSEQRRVQQGKVSLSTFLEPFAEEQKAADAQFPEWPEWIPDHKDRQIRKMQRAEDWRALNPEDAKHLDDLAPKIEDPFSLPADAGNEIVQAAYFKVYGMHKTATGAIDDQDRLSADLDRFNSGLTDEQRQKLDDSLHLQSTPREKEYYGYINQMATGGYFDRQETTFADWLAHYPSDAPGYAESRSWKTPEDLQNYLRGQAQGQGVPANYFSRTPLWRGWDKFWAARNKDWLYDHGRLDAIAVILGYYPTVHGPDGAREYAAMTGLPAPLPSQR